MEILATAFFMAIWTLYELSEGNIYGRILPRSDRVTRWKASLHLKKRGGGVDGNVYVSGFNAVRNIFNCAACLHR